MRQDPQSYSFSNEQSHVQGTIAQSKKRKNPQFYAALVIGAIINAIVLLILGGFTVYQYVAPEETALEAPPALVPIEPPSVTYNQSKTKDRQKKSQKPKQQRITTKAISLMNTPEIDIQIAQVAPGVSVDATIVDSLDSGYGLSRGGMRMGESAVDFFGIKSKGERIAIIVDVSRHMLIEERGDIPGFIRVKEQVQGVIEGLSSATLFNLIAFSNDVDAMSGDLILANTENKERAARFMEPYWKADGGRFAPDAKKGPYLRNVRPKFGGEIIPISGSGRMDKALATAFEMNADAIFMITCGVPNIARKPTEKEAAATAKAIDAWEKRKARYSKEDFKEYEAKVAKARELRKKEVEADRKRRDAKGLDPRIGSIKSKVQWPKSPWGGKPGGGKYIRGDERFIDWMKELAEINYGNRRDWPPVHVIGYSISQGGGAENFLNRLRKAFPGGKYKPFGNGSDNS